MTEIKTHLLRIGDTVRVSETGSTFFIDMQGNFSRLREDLDQFDEGLEVDLQQKIDWEQVLNASFVDDSLGSAAFPDPDSGPRATSTPLSVSNMEVTQQPRCTPPIPWEVSNNISGASQEVHWQPAIIWIPQPHIMLSNPPASSSGHRATGWNSPPPLTGAPPQPHPGLFHPVPAVSVPYTSRTHPQPLSYIQHTSHGTVTSDLDLAHL